MGLKGVMINHETNGVAVEQEYHRGGCALREREIRQQNSDETAKFSYLMESNFIKKQVEEPDLEPTIRTAFVYTALRFIQVSHQ